MVLRTFIFIFLLSSLTSCKNDLGEMPELNLTQTDHSETKVSDYINGKTSLIIHFDADCKTCQEEAQEIVDNIDKLNDVKIVFVSTQTFDKIALFDEYFKLSEQPNIIVGKDDNDVMQSHFKLYSTPLIALIDKDRDVRKVISSQIKAPELIELINEIK